MKITCDSCGAKYTIADDKVRGRKVKIRCKGCGTPIVVDGAQPTGGAAPAAEEALHEGDVPLDAAGPSVAPSSGEWSVNLSETDQRTLSTQQLIQGWANGSVTADAFVWKEGMSDWLPILECAELSQLLAAPPSPAAAAAPPASARPAASAARVIGGRGQVGTDLFAGVEQAGADLEEVNTSAPALPNVTGRANAEDARPTGQRNENSVLFSLDALKAGFSGPAPTAAGSTAPGGRAAAPTRGSGRAAAAPSDDPFGLGSAGMAGLGGGGPMFSLADNNALLTAPAPPEPPKPVISFAADPGAPGQAAGSSKKTVVLAVLAVLLVGGIGAAYTLSANKEKEEALAAAAAAAASAEKAYEEERKARASEERAREEQRAQEAKAAAAAQANANKPEEKAASASSAEPPKPGAAAPTSGKAAAKPGEKKEDPKTPPPAPAGGDQPFSKASAVAALGAAAGGAGGCKKLGGPTGAGKVTVTFATSGRVTSANVQGAPYAGTSVGGCVASIFRKAKVPPFSGSPVTVSKSFSIN